MKRRLFREILNRKESHKPIFSNDNKRKKIMMISIGILAILILIVITKSSIERITNPTSNVILNEEKIKELSQTLNETNNEKEEIKKELEIKNNNLEEKNNEIQSKEQIIKEKELLLSVEKEKTGNYETEISSLKQENKEITEKNLEYEKIISYSVRTICCSLGQIQNNEQISWEIKNGAISCSGNNSLYCGVG